MCYVLIWEAFQRQVSKKPAVALWNSIMPDLTGLNTAHAWDTARGSQGQIHMRAFIPLSQWCLVILSAIHNCATDTEAWCALCTSLHCT